MTEQQKEERILPPDLGSRKVSLEDQLKKLVNNCLKDHKPGLSGLQGLMPRLTLLRRLKNFVIRLLPNKLFFFITWKHPNIVSKIFKGILVVGLIISFLHFYFGKPLTSDTYRYLLSSFIQVFGAVFVGNAIFLIFRHEITEKQLSRTRDELASYCDFLNKEIKNIPLDFQSRAQRADFYTFKMNPDEHTLWDEALKLITVLNTSYRASRFGEFFPDEEIATIIAKRAEALKEDDKTKLSEWFNRLTMSMFYYDRYLFGLMEVFVGDRIKSKWTAIISALFWAPLLGMLVNSLLLMLCDTNNTYGLKVLTFISLFLTFGALITILWCYKSVLEGEATSLPTFSPGWDSEYERKYKDWIRERSMISKNSCQAT